MKNVSEHVTYAMAIKSDTAKRLGIANIPSASDILRLEVTANNIYELIVMKFGLLPITSFYRCPKLNAVVGGATNSQHLKGEAIDIDAEGTPYTNAELFHYILENLEFDQLIWEHGDDTSPDWVHVSYRIGQNRGNVLVAKRVNGKVIYSLFQPMIHVGL